ncbi:Serine/threonine exchanger SteT [Terricaulis silvestris]|uniref:Serine/threonine exchanger SteT n=2 Tax=Terricaulis silvestris TaxID=2686094 RepID=A0A6I6MFM8_9CAUL|nr:Serine/threonine exchanger SteT [Terricaulis silvestris]
MHVSAASFAHPTRRVTWFMTDLAAAPRRHISANYVAMLAVGMVVGAGIFRSPAAVAEAAGSPEWLFAAWALGGLITLVGALCYAELATAFPHPGGDYHFLRLAYGRNWSFLFAWARFTVINSGSVALLGYVLGDYLNVVIPLGTIGPPLYAALSVIILTAFNLRGAGKGHDAADYSLTGLEVVGLLAIVAAALALILQGVPAVEGLNLTNIAAPPPSFGYALVYALLAFGGWSEVATLSAEVRDPKRGMLRALVMAAALITVLYLAVNWAFWYGLGVEGLAASTAPAADLIAKAFGPWAGVITALAIAFAVITSINATIVVGGRTTYACAHDWPALKRIGRWDEKRQIPSAAIWAQGIISLALVVFGAFYQGFATLVDYTAPVYWLFLAMSGIAVIVLRIRQPNAERPFKTPLYPVLPILFALSSVAMLWSALSYVTAETGAGALVSLCVLGSGIIALFFVARAKPAASPPN